MHRSTFPSNNTTTNSAKIYPRKYRRRDGAAPRQLNPLKPQYCDLLASWRDNNALEPYKWVQDHYENLSLPFVIDVGCGEGEWAIEMASRSSDLNILGLELRSKVLTEARRQYENSTCDNSSSNEEKKINSFLLKKGNLALLDANVLAGDLQTIFTDIIKAGGNIVCVLVQFPDPHWKSKHHKRRMLCPILIDTCTKFLTSSKGFLFVRTDVKTVAEDASRLVEAATPKQSQQRQPLEEEGNYVILEQCSPPYDKYHHLLLRLQEIPTERMLYVQRKRRGSMIYERMFQITTKENDSIRDSSIDAQKIEDDDIGHNASIMEPLFGVYDY